jgi:hypothetical protein
MEEERARHDKGRGFHGLNALDEDEENESDAVDEEDDSSDDDNSSIDELPVQKKKASIWGHVADDQVSAIQRDMQKTVISKDHPQPRHKQPAATRKAVPAKRVGGFELNMEGATLLSRRGKGMEISTGPGSDAAAKAAAKALKVQS